MAARDILSTLDESEYKSKSEFKNSVNRCTHHRQRRTKRWLTSGIHINKAGNKSSIEQRDLRRCEYLGSIRRKGKISEHRIALNNPNVKITVRCLNRHIPFEDGT